MNSVSVYLSASAIHPDGREEFGWIDPDSKTQFVSSREEAEVFNYELNPSDEGSREILRDLIRDALCILGAFTDNGNGTFSSEDTYMSKETGVSYLYSLHFKYNETGWDISRSGLL